MHAAQPQVLVNSRVSCQQAATPAVHVARVKLCVRGSGRLPHARPLLGLSRGAVTRPDGSVLNTCPASVLAEILRFLKRCYWPFAWTTAPAAPAAPSGNAGADLASGGFANAAQARPAGAFRVCTILSANFSMPSRTRDCDASGRNMRRCVPLGAHQVRVAVRQRRLHALCMRAWAGCSAHARGRVGVAGFQVSAAKGALHLIIRTAVTCMHPVHG